MAETFSGLAFNFYQYLIDNALVDYAIVVDGWLKKSPNDCINLIESGGRALGDLGNVENPNIQVLVRGKNKPAVREQAYNVYGALKANYGIVLPEFIKGGLVFPSVEVAQITAIQRPGYIGTDAEGRLEYSTNYTLYIGGSCNV